MVSTDRNIFDENSEVRQRMIEYGKFAEELHIIVFTEKNFRVENIGNVFLYPTNSRNKLFYIFDAIKIGKKILVASGQWLITSQDPFEAGLVGWRLAKKFKLPLQLQIHTDFLSQYFKKESLLNRFRVYLARFLIKRANCIRVVSERIRTSLLQATRPHRQRSVAGAASYKLQAKTVVLPIFVDIEKIKNTPIKTDLRKKYPQFDFIILTASRLTKEKNIELAIDAMAEVVKQYPKTGLVIVGDGPEQQNLKSKIPTSPAGGSNLKINDNVKIENWTDDLSSYYKTADLFLLTSNYEGYGRTLIEAMACGSKMVSSNVGIADEILPKENIFEPGNKEQLKEKIIKAINGELKVSNTECLTKTKILSKEQYLEAYKKSWENCASSTP